jgi:hypothetical protein
METNNDARVSNLGTTFEIPLKDAQTWAKAWADKGNFVKGFLIDASELRGIIDETGASYVRVYFAWDDTMEPGREEKLIMVPANIDGNDMVPLDADHSNVFDFTNPCPPTCDSKSPLYYPGKGEGCN